MRSHRFYVKNEIEKDNIFQLSESQSKQLLKVFRMKKGDQIIIFNGDGSEWISNIIEIKNFLVSVNPISKKIYKNRFRKFNLAIGVCKNNRFEFCIEKCTELGVSTIIPLLSDRVQNASKNFISKNKIFRWSKISFEASEQSNRLTVPLITEPLSLERVIKLNKGNINFVLDSDGENIEFYKNVLFENQKPITVFVGPPGGFTERELNEFSKEKIKKVSLGQMVLRTETAAIVSAALVNQLLVK